MLTVWRTYQEVNHKVLARQGVFSCTSSTATENYRNMLKAKKAEYLKKYRQKIAAQKEERKRNQELTLEQKEGTSQASNYKHQYYQQHKEKLTQQKKEYYQQNKQKFDSYYKENAEKYKLYKRSYYQKNKDQLDERQNILRALHREKLKQQLPELKCSIESEFCIQDPSDWYKISRSRLFQTESKQIRRVFQIFSIREVLVILYPSERWLDFKFSGLRVPKKTWTQPAKIREILQFIEVQLGVKDPDDWYRISKRQIEELGGKGLIKATGSLANALALAFPEIKWDIARFAKKTKKSRQRLLAVLLQEKYPSTEICENYGHPDLLWKGNQKMELDIWLSSLSLAVEYQGEQHYHRLVHAFGVGGDEKLYFERDEKKSLLCQEKGIKLVVVPYWWDGERASLNNIMEEFSINE
eukprot:TRINITY_DN8633_c0_g1_i1.p1 TRINITY_DN8633_c0_g1~~TRINITY_DN8633_c0_g1_i1.p1  ORF type:complete len:412 (+),score=83.11 TRINITY_DN8633_c0_g1_i1:54-1289(+)